MSHFLARLIERTRGTAARVEPLVTPRFASTPIVEMSSEMETPPQVWRDRQPKMEKGSSPRSSVQDQTPIGKTAQKLPGEPDKSLLSPEIVASGAEPEQLLVPPKKSADLRLVVRPYEARDRATPLVNTGFLKNNSVAGPTAKRPASPTPATTMRRSFEPPLVEPNESSGEPPIVRITIGRIDVRATPATVSARKSSARSGPNLTLDGYLKSRREGTR